jgi:transposase
VWDRTVRVEHELKVGAVPDQVLALARGPAALSAMPGWFAFGVPAEVTGTDRLRCLITANRTVTCAMVDVAKEIDGQMICWQARSTRLQVLDGILVTEVAERFGVARQTVHRWVARYRDSGIEGLADRSHAPKSHPWRISAEVEPVICDLRGSHRRWGPRRLVFELGKRGHPVCRSTVYRVLVRHQLLQPVPRRRRRDQYRRWERSAAMELWQMDVTASLFLADGRECKIITGIDDHSRFCVIATVYCGPVPARCAWRS